MSQVAHQAGAQVPWLRAQTVVLGATGVALGLAVAGLASYHSSWATAAMVILVVATAAIFVRALGWSVGLTLLLIVTCLIDRNTFPVGRLNIRPEQVAGLLALVVWMVFFLRARRDLKHIWPDRTEVALLAWFALAFVSSVVSAPNRIDSLKVLALLIVSSLALFLPRRLLANGPEKLEAVVGWALLAIALECVYASLVYFVHVFGPTISISLNPATGHLNAYGTLWEPNVFGSVAGAGAAAWVYLGPRYFKHSWIGVATCLTACAASFARAAWLAVIVVLLLTLATPIRRRIDLRTLGLGAVGTALAVAWILASDRLGNYTQGGGVGSSVGNATDILGRLYQFAPAFRDLKLHPILGGGIDSFGQRHVRFDGLPEHLGNLELLVLNDTGVLGLLVFAAFVVTIVIAVWRCRENPVVLGLAALTSAIAIANQATETLELMITWLLIGLLLAATDAGARVSSPSSARTARDTGS